MLSAVTEPTVFTEENWGLKSIEDCEKNGKDANPGNKYRASKTLAERAAWDFVAEHKGSLSWDLVVLNPPYVFGPVLHEVDKAEKLNTSMLDWYSTIIKGAKDNASLVKGGYVSVREPS